ncbi:MAG TPA: acyl-CoA dehydrogenase family protein [Xanthobacteraceae bacterium]|nr:acyl-CoA dehydrogenase family protein [Xanthobacteraceae bacterium]
MHGPRETPSASELLARARAMIPRLAARAAQGERERRIPNENIAEMRAAGLFHVLRPKRWGGYELDPADFFEIEIALAEGDMSTAWIYGIVGLHPWLMGLLDDRAAQDVWSGDPAALISSSLMPSGIATPEGDGYRLKGRWFYSSGCEHCTWAFLGAAIDSAGGAPERALFLVPRTEYEIIDTWHVAGLKATGSHDIDIKETFVPAYRMIRLTDTHRGYGPGQAVNTGVLYRYPFGQIFFRGVSICAIGALQGMLNAFLDYGGRRASYHGKTSEDPHVHLTCAEIAVAIDEMRAVLHHHLRLMRGYAERGELPPLSDRIRYKFHTAAIVERCRELATRLFTATGGRGLYADQPFGRIVADISAARQHFSNQYEVLGRNWGRTLFGFEDNKDLIL